MRIQIQTNQGSRDVVVDAVETSIGGSAQDGIFIPEIGALRASLHSLEGIVSLVSEGPLMLGSDSVPAGVTHILEIGVPVQLAPTVFLTLLQAPKTSTKSLLAHTNIVLKGLLSKAESPTNAPSASFLCLTGLDAGRRLMLGQAVTIVGREKHCDISLRDRSVSRNHAKVYLEGSHFIVEDGASSNGVFVNNCRVRERQVLRSGDVVMLGHSLLRFEAQVVPSSEVQPVEPSLNCEIVSTPTAPVMPIAQISQQQSYSPLEYKLLLGAAGLGILGLTFAGLSM